MTTRLALTATQQADVRSRLAQELDAGPTLLVLDNCEHVLEPVAALVAFLLATTRDLQVLATSRAPLRLAAERAVPLSQLSAVDAGQLFVQRAAATRPDAVLEPTAVRDVVDRLDGLPLAVELAAARVRTMTVAEVAAALDDRFAALRSRDRTTPDRHRTLEAVIAWSWDLLGADEQRALAWLSVFQDGFDRATAVSVLGADGSDLVDALVEQSLLVVTEDGGTARFRALETIREYAAARLGAQRRGGGRRRGPAEVGARPGRALPGPRRHRRPGRARRPARARPEQPHRRAPARPRDRRPRDGRATRGAARQPVDRHRRPAEDLRRLRRRDRAALRLGRAAGPATARPGGRRRPDAPPELDAGGRPRRLARPPPAGRQARRRVGADRPHGPRRRRTGARPPRRGRRAPVETGDGRRAAAVGGDRLRERRRRRRRADATPRRPWTGRCRPTSTPRSTPS